VYIKDCCVKTRRSVMWWASPIIIAAAAVALWLFVERRLSDRKGVAAKIVFVTILLVALAGIAFSLYQPTAQTRRWKVPASPHSVQYYPTPLK